MKFLRYQDGQGQIGYAAEKDGGWNVVRGDIFGEFEISGQKADVVKTLAPLDPPAILGIGLNYRRHAEETGAKIPEYPIVF